MTSDSDFEIFLVSVPGLESALREEAKERGFAKPKTVPGGVTLSGSWPDVWRANLELRGASRIFARNESFRVSHLAQLDKRARRVAWRSVLRQPIHRLRRATSLLLLRRHSRRVQMELVPA